MNNYLKIIEVDINLMNFFSFVAENDLINN